MTLWTIKSATAWSNVWSDNPALLAELDACWRGGFRDSELSFGLLCRVIEYVHANAYYDDKNKAEQVAVLLGDVFENGQFSRLRNSSDHTISEVNCHYLLRGRICLHLHSTSMEFHGQAGFEIFLG